MRRVISLVVLLSAANLAGCGASLPPAPPSSKESATVGPHNGLAFPLPDDLGFAEVVNEPAPEGRGRVVTTAIVVYFLAPDLKSPLPTAPTDVKFTLNVGTPTARALTLKPEAGADASATNRFSSEKGAYLVEEIRGEISATVGGKPFSAKLGGR